MYSLIVQKYKELDGIKIFHENTDMNHEDYNAQGLDNLFSAEERHFWFMGRKEFILNQMTRFIDHSSKIIEIGAGTGNVSRYLMSHGYKKISVGEMHLNGLKYAKSYGIKDCNQFNLLDAPFEGEFDTVCMFDVLEHIEDDDLALQNVSKILVERGNIVLSVPSHMWLWNRDDAIAGHKRRYTKKQLVIKLKNNGFEIVTARYFFIFITPLLYLRTILNKDDKSSVRKEEYSNDISMKPLLSNILLFISRVENKINKFLPNLFGGSLLVIARKNDSI